MHRIFRVKAYEKEHGPHFNEEYARKAVMKMENEDGTRGPHWSLEETTTLASQYGIALGSKFNRYDWFVALNMVYSEYEDEEEDFGHYRRGGRRMGMFGRRSMYDKDDYEKRDYERVEHEYDPYEYSRRATRYVRY